MLLLPLLLAARGARAFVFPNCSAPPLSENGVCDPSLSIQARAAALVANFTLDEKINNTVNTSPGVPRLGLPPYQWWSEALHGLASSPGVSWAPTGEEYSCATSFANPILLGAAFDQEAIYDVASVVSTEARAFSNVNRSGLDYWTPNINPFKDPRWGRGLETPGEDPFHLKAYVFQLLAGLQGDDSEYLKIVATCKHYAAYDLENWDGVTRYGFDAQVTPQDLNEYYLVPFRQCYRDSRSASSMCSYNAVNGVPSCANDYLLQTILRDYWNWTDPWNYITSDCDAVANIYTDHHYTTSLEQAAADALNAGTDKDCGTTYSTALPGAYAQGLFNESTLDRALIRGYSSLVKLGYFDQPEGQTYRSLSWTDVNTSSSQELAYRTAWEGITLLKNDGTLPLSQNATSSVAFVGPWANATTQLQGNYAGVACFLISPLDALRQRGLNVTYVFGTNISSSDTSGFADAVAAARNADVTIYAGGIDLTIESEGMDRDNITWPGNQLDLIAQLSQTGKPLIVFQMGGGQVDDTQLLQNANVSSLLWAGYPGQSGGTAMMDIVFGTQAPAGRLPVTQYPADYVNEVPMTDMDLRPNGPNGTSPGRTYMWYTGTPVVPFGYGLHYTTFNLSSSGNKSSSSYAISDIASRAAAATPASDTPLWNSFAVSVQNTGNTTSDYVALAFLSGDYGPTPRPNKTLVSYQRLPGIAPGASSQAVFNLTIGSLLRAATDGSLWLYPGSYNLAVDVVDPVTIATWTLTGNATQIESFPTDNSTSTNSSSASASRDRRAEAWGL